MTSLFTNHKIFWLQTNACGLCVYDNDVANSFEYYFKISYIVNSQNDGSGG